MILYGRNLSPFVRRVAIWAQLQGRALERRKLPPMGDSWDEIRKRNPVGRVPVLVLDDGTELIETFAIVDWLEETAPEGRRLLPDAGPDRLETLQRLALASSLAEKTVAMVYEKNRRPEEFQWPAWQERLTTQVRGGLASLEAGTRTDGLYHGGSGPDGADIAAVIAYQMLEATNPWLIEPAAPKLAALAERAMALPAFAETLPEV